MLTFCRGVGAACGRPAFWLWVLVGLTPLFASGAPLRLGGVAGEVALAGVAQQWREPGAGLTVSEVLQPQGPAVWGPMSSNGVFSLKAGETLWLRFELVTGEGDDPWFLELPYAPIDRLTLYQPLPSGGWLAQSAGDRVPSNTQPMMFRHPLMPLSPQTGAATFVVRLENPHDFVADLRLVRQDRFLLNNEQELLWLGSFFGLLVLAGLLAGVLWWVRRYPPLLWFALKSVALAVGVAAFFGVAGVQWWPQATEWNDLAPTFFHLVILGTTAALVHTALSSIPNIQGALRALTVLALVCTALAAAVAVIPPQARILLLSGVTLAVLGGCLLGCWVAHRRGDPSARWLALALLPMLLIVVLPLARAFGVPVANTALRYSFLIGAALESPLMLLVLSWRSQPMVEQRRRLRGDEVRDPATGLVLEGVFLARGAEMIARCRRFRHQAQVLVIDLVNTDEIARDYRRFRPDELPVRVAARLQSLAREVDVVARLSERRFGMLIEGPVSETEELAMGPRLVANCLMPYPDKPEGWVARVHVASALVPLDGRDIEVVVERLKQLLAGQSQHSKRTVFTLTHGEPESQPYLQTQPGA